MVWARSHSNSLVWWSILCHIRVLLSSRNYTTCQVMLFSLRPQTVAGEIFATTVYGDKARQSPLFKSIEKFLWSQQQLQKYQRSLFLRLTLLFY